MIRDISGVAAADLLNGRDGPVRIHLSVRIIAVALLQGPGDHIFLGLEEAVEGLPGDAGLPSEGADADPGKRDVLHQPQKGAGYLILRGQGRFIGSAVHENLLKVPDPDRDRPNHKIYINKLDSCLC